MTIQQLEYIVAVNHYRHFVKAAEACNISQPTLSAMIQKLEEELDVKIFDRSKHPIEPTEIGVRIIAQAKATLKDMALVKELVDSEVSTLAGSLYIGILPTIAPYIVPKFIELFTKDYPQIDLHVSEMRLDAVSKALSDSTLDMAIMATPVHNNELLEIPLYYEKLVAYLSPDCKYKGLQLKASQMPEDDLWVLQEGQCILRDQVFNFCHSETVNHCYEAGNIDTLIRIVDQNGGYTVIPELHIPFLSAEQRPNIRDITDPPAVREVSIVIRSHYVKERLLNAVADTIKLIIPQEMLDERLKKYSIRL